MEDDFDDSLVDFGDDLANEVPEHCPRPAQAENHWSCIEAKQQADHAGFHGIW